LKLSYLSRCFLYNKAIAKATIKPEYIFILHAISLLQPVGWLAILNVLTKVKRGRDRGVLTQYLDYLTANGYIIRNTARKYSLTPYGLSILKDIETRLRNERHDK
jgi:hypothetical protein